MFTNLQLIHLPKAEPLRLGVFARVIFFASGVAKENLTS
jgi:hypothetical protein